MTINQQKFNFFGNFVFVKYLNDEQLTNICKKYVGITFVINFNKSRDKNLTSLQIMNNSYKSTAW